VPLVAIIFTVSYYAQGRNPLIIAVLVIFSGLSLSAAFLMNKSSSSWSQWKHLLASGSLIADSITYLTQTDSPEQIVWFVTFPMFIFEIAGFSAGWKYILVFFIVYILGYFNPILLGHPLNLNRDVTIHTLIAFLLTSVIFAIYQYKKEKYQKALERTVFRKIRF